ncbi:MAG: glycosyltransferase family 39 protein, partial [Sulfurovaceae bacterium]|nr:glycosyltransferase family 39 protein [Sulfurovaceae bacterium]
MKRMIKDVFWLTLIVWITILALFIFSKGYEFDESTHSLVGIFIKDLIVDWINKPTFSFHKIYSYAVSYLVYYPKISLHYPPLPQTFFAISYLFLEETIIVSRIVVIIFSALSVILIYYITLHIYRKKEIALISCLILITSPIMILFSTRAVQEMFFLFFFTSAIFSYIKLFKKTTFKRYAACIALTAACILTKWHAITILPVVFFFTLLFHREKMKSLLMCFIFTSIILVPYYLLLYKTGIVFLPFESNLYTGTIVPQWYQIDGWLYYPKTLIFDSFFPFMGILLLISTFYYIKQKKKLWNLFLVWIITIYIIMTIVLNKTPHYIINMIPALVIPSSFIIYKFIVKNKI